MSIAMRIVLLIALAIAGLIGLGGFSLYQMAKINNGVKETNEVTIPGILKLNEAQTAFLLARPFLINVLIESDPARRETLVQRFNERMAEMNAAFADYEKLVHDDKDRELLAHDKKTAAAYLEFAKQYMAAALAGNRDEAMTISRNAADTVNGLSNALVEHAKFIKTHAEESAKEAYDIHNTAINLVVGAIVLLSLVVATIGLLIYRHVSGGLDRMVTIFTGIEKDLDFTGRLDVAGNDELAKVAHAFNGLLERLQQSFRKMSRHAESVNQAAQRVSTAARQMSVASQYQSEAASSMAAAVEEMTVSVNHVADRAEDTRRLATSAGSVAARGQNIIGETVLSINGIATTVQSASEQLTALEKQSEKISTIVSVIKDIADQTNLLALNAAIEAARAGEQGRGFAVVASEVRALAGRTATAAREVKQLITDSAEKVRAGSELTQAAQTTMQEAVQSVEHVTNLVTQISGGAREQLSGISQINSAVAQLDGITQQNAAAVEQIAAASMSLAQRAKSVAEAVQVFRTDVGGSSAYSQDAVALRKEMKAQASRQALSAPA